MNDYYNERFLQSVVICYGHLDVVGFTLTIRKLVFQLTLDYKRKQFVGWNPIIQRLMHAIRDATYMVNFSGFFRHCVVPVNFFDWVDGSVGKTYGSHDTDRQTIAHFYMPLHTCTMLAP